MQKWQCNVKLNMIWGENHCNFTNWQSLQHGAFCRDLLDEKSKYQLFLWKGGGSGYKGKCVKKEESLLWLLATHLVSVSIELSYGLLCTNRV